MVLIVPIYIHDAIPVITNVPNRYCLVHSNQCTARWTKLTSLKLKMLTNDTREIVEMLYC